MVNLPLLDISRKYGSRGSDMIDGFNIVITLEVLLSDSLLFSCMDGTIKLREGVGSIGFQGVYNSMNSSPWR